MSKSQQAINKRAILETPGFNQVLFDALKVYILEARGEERDDLELAEMTMAVITSLKVSYRSPSKIPTRVKQVDLEDSIAEIKREQDEISNNSTIIFIRVNNKFSYDNKDYIVTKAGYLSNIYVRMLTQDINTDPHLGAEFEWTKGFNDVKWLR